jgi:flagellar hook-basal body complex protein FliE
MTVQLDPSRLLPSATQPSTARTSHSASGQAFGDSLTKLLEAVDSTTGQANVAVGKMLDGSVDVHEAMIALQRAETTLQLTVQVRNKLLQAYQEIMRMPV